MAIELPDGTVVRNIPEQVAYLTEANERLAQQLQMALSGVMKYKGSVATYADLPSTGQEVGDVYNVIDTGANYCWSGTEWDEIGAPIDLSQIMDLGTAQTATAKKTFSAGIASDTVEQVTPSHTLIVGNDVGFHINLDRAEANLDYGSNHFITISDDYSVTLNFDLETYLQTQDFRIFYGSDLKLVVGSQIEIYKPIVSSSGGTYGLLLPDTTAFTTDKHIAVAEDCMDLTSAQTASGVKTFTAGIKLNENTLLYSGLGSYQVQITGHTIPRANLTYDLGGSSNYWRNAYIGKINIKFSSYEYTIEDGNFGQLYIGRASGTAGIVLDGNIVKTGQLSPQSNNTYDIGSSGSKFKDLFLSGNLSDGTNTANIADIKALIDYAKAQGWIS